MKEKRKKEALNACEKFMIESKWNIYTGLVTDLWLAAIEWADNNLSNECSPAGLGGVPIGRSRMGKTEKKYR